MKIPSHYKLISEHPDHYEIHDERDGRSFPIAKRHLSLDMHGKLSEIKKYSQGGDVLNNLLEGETSTVKGDDQLPKINPLSLLQEENSSPGKYTPEEAAVATTENKPSEPKQSEEPKKEPAKEEKPVSPTAPAAAAAKPPETYIDREIKSIQGGIAAQRREGEHVAQAYQDVENKISALPSTLDIYQANKATNQKLFDAFSSEKINPRRVLQEMSTGDYALMSLALMLGGAGAGRHGENPALKMLNDAIDRDIDAQKNEQNKKYTLWQMNRSATHDEMEASAAYRAQLLTAAEVVARKEAAKAMGPRAQMEWAEKIGAIEKEREDLLLKKSLLQSANRGEILDEDPTQYLRLIKDPHTLQKAGEEIEKTKQLKVIENHVVKAIDEVMAMPRWERGFAKGEADRHAFVGTLTKLLEGTMGENQAKIFANTFFSSALQTGGRATDERKRELFAEVMESKQEGTFFQHGVGVPLSKFKMTRLGHPEPSNHKKAQNIQNNSHMENDRQYYEKYKNDPSKQVIIDRMKRRYGFK